jgi:hypothetical protein
MKAIKEQMRVVGLVILLVGLAVGVAHAQDPSDGLIPQVRVAVPNLSSQSAKIMPPTFTVGMWATDPDAESLLPVKYRYLFKSAQYDTTATGEPKYVRTPFEYGLHGPALLPWDEPGWSEWTDYPQDGSYPEIDFYDLADGEYFLMALQVMDADGAVSKTLDYQIEVFNFRVHVGYYGPQITICEQYLGCPANSSPINEIAGGQPLNFSWVADADAYGGTIVSYRHGWDLIDPNDPNDPGWAVPPGLEPENLYAAERSFQDGIHMFYLRVEDSVGQFRLISWQLRVVPYVSRENQLELLLIDQTVDALSQAWMDQSGIPRDNEDYRNAYWAFLGAGAGGVNGFNPDRDWMDHTEIPMYSDLVKYKAVLCYARKNALQTMYMQFRPENGEDKFVWLAPYQHRGGNYFQVGDRSMESYLEESPDYMIPIIFDAPETYMVIGDVNYILGFGQKENPDGSLVARGPLMYPYATAGIAAVDWTSPSDKTIYGRTLTARYDRDVDCVGLKGLVLDPDFKAYHGLGPGVIADTLFTDQVIDWHDAADAAAGGLDLFAGTFPFRNDEFVDANITTRPTPILPQGCGSIPEAPDGMCIEPMFTGIARMDWVREEKWADGDTGWPYSEYTDPELLDGCGSFALTSYEGMPNTSGRTNDRTFGYMSYKMIEDKPARKPDVYWGFDPYRFDHDETKKAIRWVLQTFGLQINP